MSLKKGKKIIKLENLNLFPSNNFNFPHSSITLTRVLIERNLAQNRVTKT